MNGAPLVPDASEDTSSAAAPKWKKGLVALKAIRSVKRYIESAQIEAGILIDIRREIMSSTENMIKGENIIIMEETFDFNRKFFFLFLRVF